MWTACNETWYIAFGIPASQNLFKLWLWVTLTYFIPRSNLVAEAFVLSQWKLFFLSEIVAACDLKFVRCIQLYELMKLYECQKSRSFIDLGQDLSGFKIIYYFSQKLLSHFETKAYMKTFEWSGTKIYTNSLDHMKKMDAWPYMLKTKTSFSREPNEQWPLNLICSIELLRTTRITQLVNFCLSWPFWANVENAGTYHFMKSLEEFG